MKCYKCKDALSTEDSLKCITCNCYFHYKCVGLNDMDFKKILPMNKTKWKCPPCKSMKKINIPSPEPSSHSIINIEATAIMAHLDEKFSILKSAIDSLRSDVNEKLLKLTSKVNSWETRMNSFASSISAVDAQITDLKSENEKLKLELDSLRSNVKVITEENSRNEQWVRRSNIQINGVPEKKGENLLSLVSVLAKKCGFNINMNTDIDFVTRIAVKNDTDNKTPKPIILKMQSRYKKDELLTSLRKIKNCTANDIGISGAQSNYKIYFNDHLSAKNKYLLKKAKQLAKDNNYAYCWVRNCTVMVRRSDQSPVLHITSEESLKKVT